MKLSEQHPCSIRELLNHAGFGALGQSVTTIWYFKFDSWFFLLNSAFFVFEGLGSSSSSSLALRR